MHVSAGAQIGGVIEPVGALPVIIEDDVLIGGNTGIYEGAVIKTRAVIAAGTVLTGSTPVYDLVKGDDHQADRGSPARRSGRRRRRAGRARRHGRQGPRVGPLARDAGHRQVPRLANRHAHGARSVDPVARCAHARAGRHRFDDRPRRRGGPLAGATTCATLGFTVTEQPRRRHARSTSSRPTGSATADPSCSRRISTACRRSFPAASKAIASTAAASCDAKGILAAQVAAADRLRRDGESRVGLLFVVGEERGSDGAQAANDARPAAAGFSSTASRPTTASALATRGILRLKLRATGRAAHSSFPELGESAIDKLIDALDRAAGDRAAGRSRPRPHALHGRPDRRAAWRRMSCRRRRRPK